MSSGQFFPVDDFRGGLSDHYLTADQNQAGLFNNLLIDEDGHPFVRDGLQILNRAPVATGYLNFSGLWLGEAPYGSPVAFRRDSAYYLGSSDVWHEIQGPQGNVAAPGKLKMTFEALEMWQKQLVYAGGDDVFPHRIYCPDDSPLSFTALTLGLPALASTPTGSSSGGSGHNYIYAFHYYYTFTDYNGTTFEEKGPIVTLEKTNVGIPNSNNLTIGSIPVLANTSSTNYDVDNIVVKIFRTIDNGTTFYYVNQVTNGTTSYVDSALDATIQGNDVIYTDGGILEYTQPPTGAKYVTQVNDFFWYATNLLVTHSIQGAPGASPEEYQYFTDQKIKGLSSIISFPILFCDKSVYRIEGNFDEIGDGGFELREISKTAGCVSHRSVVAVPGGLVWAGNGGFYFTDGNSVQKIAIHLEDHYQQWKSPNIVGCYDSIRNLVLWTISSSPQATTAPNDIIAVMHFNFGLGPKCVFTTIDSANNIYPTVVAFSESDDVDSRFRDNWVIMDGHGYLLYSDPLCYTDPKITNDGTEPANFKKRAIIYRWESAGLNLGTDALRKYCTHITASLRNETDTAVEFLSRRDDGGAWGALSEIRSDGAILWQMSEPNWDDPNDDTLHDWDSQPVIEGKRHLPAGTLRSNRRQIGFTNATTWICKSDDADKGVATTAISGSNKTVTLDNASNFWPEDCEFYEIAFGPTYDTFYQIKDRTSDTVIKVYDPYATFTAVAARKWQIRGKRKFERMHMLNFAIFFGDAAATQAPNRGTAQYENA